MCRDSVYDDQLFIYLFMVLHLEEDMQSLANFCNSNIRTIVLWKWSTKSFSYVFNRNNQKRIFYKQMAWEYRFSSYCTFQSYVIRKKRESEDQEWPKCCWECFSSVYSEVCNKDIYFRIYLSRVGANWLRTA